MDEEYQPRKLNGVVGIIKIVTILALLVFPSMKWKTSRRCLTTFLAQNNKFCYCYFDTFMMEMDNGMKLTARNELHDELV